MYYNCHSCFSLRYGTLTVDDLLDLAEARGFETLGLTDINNTSAGLEFIMKARKRGIRPILGIEFRVNNRLRYIGLARNAFGWRGLCEFLSEYGARNNGLYQATAEVSEEDLENLVFPERALEIPETLFVYPFSQAPPLDQLREFEYVAIRPAELNRLYSSPYRYAGRKLVAFTPVTFRDKVGFNTHRLLRAIDRNSLLTKQETWDVAAQDEFMYPLGDLLRFYQQHTQIVTNTLQLMDLCDFEMSFDAPKNKKFFTGSQQDDLLLLEKLTWDGVRYRYGHLSSLNSMGSSGKSSGPEDSSRKSSGSEGKLENGSGAEESFGDSSGSEDSSGKGSGSESGLAARAAAWRTVEERVRKELEIINRLGFSAYFLITWDFVRYGQSRGFFHVGRGSGANSIVAYCMGITDVDPIELNLYFERFLNPHRTSPPDFDIDFSWKDRDDVIDYVFKRYGRKYTTLMATYNTFKGRSIIRELGKVFGLPKSEIDLLVARRHAPQIDDHIVKLIYRYGKELDGKPNYLGIHPGGILISEEPVRSYAATEIPPKGFPVVQFDMFVAEDAGLYKYDVLSQRGLGHIKDSAIQVQQNRKVTVDVHQVRDFKEDPKIAALVQQGDTIGCFYVESPAMRQLLRKLHCDNYLTLVAASSVIRPGVARSGMMRQFIERHNASQDFEMALTNSDPRICEAVGSVSKKAGDSKDTGADLQMRENFEAYESLKKSWYMHPKMEAILGETYGVMVYQEDVIKVAHHFGGVGLGEADVLRRGMSGKYRSKNHFEMLRENYFKNCREMGYEESVTAEVWRQMESFSGYSFCKAHSASFAVESYQSLFFKAHYPREFMVGVINNFGGFYRTEVYIHEARRGGATIEPPCINEGGYLTGIHGETIWLGLIHVQGLEKKTAVGIEMERRTNGAFQDINDLLRRVAIGLETLTTLIRVGALRFTGKTKKALLWEANLKFAKEAPRKQKAELFASKGRNWSLPDLPDDPLEDAYDELELLGYIISPLRESAPVFDSKRLENAVTPPIYTLLEQPLDPREVLAKDFAARVGQVIAITGFLICTKRVRTIKGDMMGFSDFIDVRGDFFDTVLFPDAYEKYNLSYGQLYRLRGKLVDDFGVVAVEVRSVERLAYRGDPRNE